MQQTRQTIRPAAKRALFAGCAALLAVGVAAADVNIVARRVAVFESEPPMVLPTTVAVGQDGRVYVADGVNARIAVFDADGKPAGEIRGPADSPLREPVGVTIAPDRRVWVADSGNSRVVIFESDGAFVRHIPLPTGDAAHAPDPTTLAFDPTAAGAWVADNDGDRLLRYDIAGGTWQVVGVRGEALGQFQRPFAIAVRSDGDLYVTDVLNARAQMFSAAGQALRSIGTIGIEPGELFRPGGLACDEAGNAWVADSVVGVIQVFRSDGSCIDYLRDADGAALRFESPLGLAFDDAGRLYVVEQRAHRVVRLEIEQRKRADPPIPERRERVGVGRQSKACVVCHIDWASTFAENRDTPLMPRPESSPDQPAVSRAEMCLSCHDGAVGDSRHRVWLDHGHRTGVTPPATMKIPANLPLVRGKLACRTCHSAHGSGVAEGDLSQMIPLRVKNVASELCMSCHADKTRGPAFGTHPTGGMPWPVPPALVDAGAKIGPNPRELTCQVCHTPHGAKEDHLLVMGTASNQLCVTCHDQMRPGMFRPGGAREHPLSPSVSAEQAAAVERLGTKLSPEGNLICLSCHKLHHGYGARFMLAAPLHDGEMCLSCHSGRAIVLGSPHDLRSGHPDERNRLGMTVADGGPCSACHLFHRYAREPAGDEFDPRGQCVTCHADGQCAENRQLGDKNHPPIGCTSCHNPHEPAFGAFMKAPPHEVCSCCHADQAGLAGGPHDASRNRTAFAMSGLQGGDACLACHTPHGDRQRGLFRLAASSPGGASANDATCTACHSTQAWHAGTATEALHPHGGASGVTCRSCHDPHVDRPSLLRQYGQHAAGQPCIGCHDQAAHIVRTEHAPQMLANAGFAAESCAPCHRSHGDPSHSPTSEMWGISAVAPIVREDGDRISCDDVHCTACHREGGGAPVPAIAWHPKVLTFDPAATSAPETRPDRLPLYNDAGVETSDGHITCRTCHLPHGRDVDPTRLAQAGFPTTALGLHLRPFEAPNVCTTCHGADGLRRFLYFHDENRRRTNTTR